MNGDNAEEPGQHQTLSQVPSFLRPVGGHTQIYAPAQNENVYTNLWRGPYYGFRRVIDYFRFTDSPRRLKPIGIYYHFYSGTKTAAIKALHDVYAWASQQETFPVSASEYAASSAASNRRRWPAVSTDAGCFVAWARSPPCGCPPRSAGRISTSRRASSACATSPGTFRGARAREESVSGLVRRRATRALSSRFQCGRHVLRALGRRPRFAPSRAHARRGGDRRMRPIDFVPPSSAFGSPLRKASNAGRSGQFR